jgi:hypothetical protein
MTDSGSAFDVNGTGVRWVNNRSPRITAFLSDTPLPALMASRISVASTARCVGSSFRQSEVQWRINMLDDPTGSRSTVQAADAKRGVPPPITNVSMDNTMLAALELQHESAVDIPAVIATHRRHPSIGEKKA